jgi:hypothetical protein
MAPYDLPDLGSMSIFLELCSFESIHENLFFADLFHVEQIVMHTIIVKCRIKYKNTFIS